MLDIDAQITYLHVSVENKGLEIQVMSLYQDHSRKDKETTSGDKVL